MKEDINTVRKLIKALYKKDKTLAKQVENSFETLPKHIQKVLEKISWDNAISFISKTPKSYTVFTKFGLIDKKDLKVLVKEPTFLHLVTSKPYCIGLKFKNL